MGDDQGSSNVFPSDQRKEIIAQKRLADLRRAGPLRDGVYLIGKAQEKCSTFRTHKRRNPDTGATYGHIFRSTVMCNQYFKEGLRIVYFLSRVQLRLLRTGLSPPLDASHKAPGRPLATPLKHIEKGTDQLCHLANTPTVILTHL